MCHFLAPAGQPEMMHKNFMLMSLRIFVVQCSCMKFRAYFYLTGELRLCHGNSLHSFFRGYYRELIVK